MDVPKDEGLVEILKRSILTLCQGRLQYASCLEVVGSIHIRCDRNKALSFMLEEELTRGSDNPQGSPRGPFSPPGPQTPLSMGRRPRSCSSEVLDLTMDLEMDRKSRNVWGQSLTGQSPLSHALPGPMVKQEPITSGYGEPSPVHSSGSQSIGSPPWFRPSEDIKPTIGLHTPSLPQGLEGHTPTQFAPSIGPGRPRGRGRGRGRGLGSGLGRKTVGRRPGVGNAPIVIYRGNQIKYQCQHCDVVLSTRQSLANHMNSYHFKTESYTCPSCGKQFNTNAALYIHKKRKHGFIPQKFNCTYCGQTFRSIPKLQQHTTKCHAMGSISHRQPPMSPRQPLNLMSPTHAPPHAPQMSPRQQPPTPQMSPRLPHPLTPQMSPRQHPLPHLEMSPCQPQMSPRTPVPLPPDPGTGDSLFDEDNKSLIFPDLMDNHVEGPAPSLSPTELQQGTDSDKPDTIKISNPFEDSSFETSPRGTPHPHPLPGSMHGMHANTLANKGSNMAAPGMLGLGALAELENMSKNLHHGPNPEPAGTHDRQMAQRIVAQLLNSR